MELVKLMGAAVRQMDDGDWEYTEREPIWINPARVDMVYDHTVVVGGSKVRVMDRTDEIVAKIEAGAMAHDDGPVRFW